MLDHLTQAAFAECLGSRFLVHHGTSAVEVELIEAMNGSVEVESVVEEGSCFTIRLPRCSEKRDKMLT